MCLCLSIADCYWKLVPGWFNNVLKLNPPVNVNWQLTNWLTKRTRNRTGPNSAISYCFFGWTGPAKPKMVYKGVTCLGTNFYKHKIQEKAKVYSAMKVFCIRAVEIND